MAKITYYVKLDIPHYLSELLQEYQTLASMVANGQVSATDEKRYCDLFREVASDLLNDDANQQTILDNAKPLHDCSIVCWLPVNGTIAPKPFTDYLITNGNNTTIGQINLSGKWTLPKGCASFVPTYYADLPKHTGGLTHVQSRKNTSAVG